MRPNNRVSLSVLFLLLLLFISCRENSHRVPDAWDLTEEQMDSLRFARQHHYSQGYNFKVEADSLSLLPALPDEGPTIEDSCVVHRNDPLVVADIRVVPDSTSDSVWIKVARDQMTMGWIAERNLLPSVVPDDPISWFIHLFSSKIVIFFVLVLVLAITFQFVRSVRRKRIRMIHFNDIDSIYPTLLCITLSGAAVLYSTIQMFAPDTWQEFYYHPTLNPFGQGWILTFFLVAVWSFLILLIATLDDVRHKLSLDGSIPYLLSLGGFVLMLYLFFTFTTLVYVGYLFLPLYWIFAVYRFRRYSIWHYTCGGCGKRLRHKGTCPHCGALNV